MRLVNRQVKKIVQSIQFLRKEKTDDHQKNKGKDTLPQFTESIQNKYHMNYIPHYTKCIKPLHVTLESKLWKRKRHKKVECSTSRKLCHFWFTFLHSLSLPPFFFTRLLPPYDYILTTFTKCKFNRKKIREKGFCIKFLYVFRKAVCVV